MKCNNCGVEFKEGSFCPKCGIKNSDNVDDDVNNQINTIKVSLKKDPIKEQNCLRTEQKNLKQKQKSIEVEQDSLKIQENIKIEYGNLRLEQENIKSEYENLKRLKENIKVDREHLRRWQKNIEIEQENLKLEQENVKVERENIKKEQENIKIEYGNLRLEQENIKSEYENLKKLQENIKVDREHLRRWQKNIEIEQENLKLEQENIKVERENIRKEQENLRKKQESIKSEQEILEKNKKMVRGILYDTLEEAKIAREEGTEFEFLKSKILSTKSQKKRKEIFDEFCPNFKTNEIKFRCDMLKEKVSKKIPYSETLNKIYGITIIISVIINIIGIMVEENTGILLGDMFIVPALWLFCGLYIWPIWKIILFIKSKSATYYKNIKDI